MLLRRRVPAGGVEQAERSKFQDLTIIITEDEGPGSCEETLVKGT